MVTIRKRYGNSKNRAYKDSQAKEALNQPKKSFLVRYGAYNTTPSNRMPERGG